MIRPSREGTPDRRNSSDQPESVQPDSTWDCEHNCICDGEPYDGETIKCPNIAKFLTALNLNDEPNPINTLPPS